MTKFLRVMFATICVAGTWAFAADFEDGLVYYNSQDFDLAQQVFREIKSNEPENLQAMYYDVLCSYELKNFEDCKNAYDQAKEKLPLLSPEQRENIDGKYTIAIFNYHDFKLSKSFSRDFLTTYPASNQIPAVRNVAILSLFEWGRKNLIDARVLDPVTQKIKKEERLSEGVRDLSDFVTASDEITTPDCVAIDLPKGESIKEKTWIARLLTGGESQLINEANGYSRPDKEKVHYLQIRTHQEFFPESKDVTIALCRNFIEQFPDSPSIPRVKFRLANTLMEQSTKLIDRYNRMTDQERTTGGLELQEVTSDYLTQFRQLCYDDLLTSQSRLKESDKQDLEEDILKSHFMQNDFQTLKFISVAYANRHPIGSRPWAQGCIYESIGLLYGAPPDTEGAISLLNKVLEYNIQDKSQENVMVLAAFWRAYIAEHRRDWQVIGVLVNRVRNEMPDCVLKQAVLDRYASFSQVR